jgi:hypothetical protein
LLQEIGDDAIRDRRETGKAGIFISSAGVRGLSNSDEKSCMRNHDAMLSLAASFDARVPAIVWLIPNHSGASFLSITA